jgi:hypothetical protein
MNTTSLFRGIVLSFALGACSVAPLRNDKQIQQAIATAGTGAPRLPDYDQAYLGPTWFTEPLSVAHAVQAALLNNPQVRVELTRLDAVQANRIQAGLLNNPVASLMVLRPNGHGGAELDYSVMQSLFDLLTRSQPPMMMCWKLVPAPDSSPPV